MTYFHPLKTALNGYLAPEKIKQIQAAYQFSQKAHAGQLRNTGEPYITHPVAVAQILAEMHMDSESIIAALLHDTIEDTHVDKNTLQSLFGNAIAQLVDGVSKLTQINFETRAHAQAENFRKMVLAMAHDLRVIIIKLADRLHNMRTLESLPATKRHRIARETLEIYAPIAHRLGMHAMRLELENLGFAGLYPMRYRVLNRASENAHGNREEIISSIEQSLKQTLEKNKVPVLDIVSRKKHIYSIYKKMRHKRIFFSEIMDVYGFRIIVNSVDECYRVLGIVHGLFKPVSERFKDYIAIPKSNGYQSLHTTLFGPYGVPIEVQIRTNTMHTTAESGIVSHWVYKSYEQPTNHAHIKAQAWLRDLVELQKNTGNSLEFIENVKIDLFPDEVYVFTPKGKILSLPNGACAIDFAYAIHTDIGNTCIAVKINRRIMPLSTHLESGQTIEIITSSMAGPNPNWLNFVKTSYARSNIKHYLKKQQRSASVNLGRKLLERALGTLNLSLSQIKQHEMERILKEGCFQQLDDLLETVGLGTQSPLILARRLAMVFSEEPQKESIEQKTAYTQLAQKPLLIKGTEGIAVQFARCCYPIPGDAIVGIFNFGKGLTIHEVNCENISNLKNGDQCIYVSWEPDLDQRFSVEINIELLNQQGSLAKIAQIITSLKINIENIKVEERDGYYCALNFLLSVHDRLHLAKLFRRIRVLSNIDKIYRVRHPQKRH